MNPDDWIIVPNWDRFQHYKDRDPTWIKAYLDLRSRDAWRQLTLSARGLLVCIWIEYAASRGVLRASDLPPRVAQKFPRRTLDLLQEAGFIEFSASPRALARGRERKRNPPTPLPEKGGQKSHDHLVNDLAPADPDRVQKIRELTARIGRDM